MIKLIDKKIVADEKTFQPYLEVTVRIGPFEKILEVSSDELFYNNLGNQFCDLLKEQN